MKVEFEDFVVKIKAQHKTEEGVSTEKFLYHLLGVYADAQKTAVREQKFAIAQAYNKEIKGIRDAIHHEKTAREEAEKKAHEETEELIGKKILVEDEAEYEAVINKLDNQGFRWNEGEKAKEWSPEVRFPYFIRIATGKKLQWGFGGPNENLIPAIDFIEGKRGKEERQLNKEKFVIRINSQSEYDEVANKMQEDGYKWASGNDVTRWSPFFFPHWLVLEDMIVTFTTDEKNIHGEVLAAEEFLGKQLESKSGIREFFLKKINEVPEGEDFKVEMLELLRELTERVYGK